MAKRRLFTVLPGVLALLGAATACTTVPAASGVPARTTQRAPHPDTASQQARAATAADSVTLAFAGDVHFTGRTAQLLSDPATAFGPIATVLKSADFTAVNFETAVTSRGTPQPKSYHFRTVPTAFTALRDGGVSLVTMANNHVLDYGSVGLADTLAAAKAARFPYVGIGVDAAAAWAPYVTTVKGMRIAVVGVSQVAELASSWVATASRPGEANAIDLGRTLAAVRAARRLAPTVIVFMHWGTEGEACPDPNQLSLARELSAAGASIIIGAHAHMLQGSGWLGHTFVAYGMGNFLWWENSYSTATGVLELTIHPHAPLTSRFIPAVVSSTGQPVVEHGATARQAVAHYDSLRACAELAQQPSLSSGETRQISMLLYGSPDRNTFSRPRTRAARMEWSLCLATGTAAAGRRQGTHSKSLSHPPAPKAGGTRSFGFVSAMCALAGDGARQGARVTPASSLRPHTFGTSPPQWSTRSRGPFVTRSR
jgi:poly-gamma-glutamate capsule biosynthesis protein CapA/YwtB (metallophosphatase superfamily)